MGDVGDVGDVRGVRGVRVCVRRGRSFTGDMDDVEMHLLLVY